MKTIITIGRHYGGGGKEVGKKLAEMLGIPCYDEEIVHRVADSSNIHPDVVKKVDEKATDSFLYSLITSGGLRGVSDAVHYEMPINDKVFISQSKAIKELAKKGACVFVGRCADYVLEEEENLLRVFIYADMDSKIKRISRIYNLSEKQAKDKILKTEKTRKTYYNYYTDRTWGAMSSDDLCINTGLLGTDAAAELIKECVLKRESQNG